MKKLLLLNAILFVAHLLRGQIVHIKVDANKDRKVISPYIYGRNNSLSDDPSSPLAPTDWKFYSEAGVKIFRESGGNNSTKYNWKQKITSHPDWYNNVYAHDWDFAASSLQENLHDTQGMWSFQLLGSVAATIDHNFDDYRYNASQWWEGTAQNLAGGGMPNDSGGRKALIEGDTSLYLRYWSADSSVAILDHWFGTLGLDKEQFVYWSMDNEPEAWGGTHDDVVKTPMAVEEYIKRYVAIAQKAKQKYPGIKLLGPVFTNEWQWYAWNNARVQDQSTKKYYVWAEYFIKRIAEEQIATGVKLLDVLDFHFYPNSDAASTPQMHRVWFDSTYSFPNAAGVKLTAKSGWDDNIDKEYIMKRCGKWLDQYMGAGHGVTFGVSEYGSIYNSNANIVSVWYASQLGTFASHNVEVFTPWDWYPGMWETLHLFSKYALPISANSTSDLDSLVSAYASFNGANDSATIVFVNRDPLKTFTTEMTLQNLAIPDGQYPVMTLSNLPNSETFQSHTKNALKASMASSISNQVSISLPPYSVTALQMSSVVPSGIEEDLLSGQLVFKVFPNPVSDMASVYLSSGLSSSQEIQLLDVMGRKVKIVGGESLAGQLVQIDVSDLPNGMYQCVLPLGDKRIVKKMVVSHSN